MKTSTRRATLATGLCIAAAAAMTAGGCAANADSQSAAMANLRYNTTPELDTLHQRPVDIRNRMTVTNDTNLRRVWSDLGRIWLFDRPSRLGPEPMPY